MSMGMKWMEAIEHVLAHNEPPMHYKDVLEIIIANDMVPIRGTTPSNTINSVINQEINTRGDESLFVRVGRGMYRLRSDTRPSVGGKRKRTASAKGKSSVASSKPPAAKRVKPLMGTARGRRVEAELIQAARVARALLGSKAASQASPTATDSEETNGESDGSSSPYISLRVAAVVSDDDDDDDDEGAISLEAPSLLPSEVPSRASSSADDDELYSEELALSDLERLPHRRARSKGTKVTLELAIGLAAHEDDDDDDDEEEEASDDDGASCSVVVLKAQAFGSGDDNSIEAHETVVSHDIFGTAAMVVMSGAASVARYELVSKSDARNKPERLFKRPNEDRVAFRSGFWRDEPFWLYLVADGHGGADAAEFFAAAIPPNVELVLGELLGQPGADLSSEALQSEVRSALQALFLRLDEQYLQQLRSAFEARKASLGSAVLTQAEIEATNPDNGTTLAMAVVFRGFVVTANVGDSRVMLASRRGKRAGWKVEAATVDHDVAHVERAASAAGAGATFYDIAKAAPRHLSFHSGRRRAVADVENCYVVAPSQMENPLRVPRRKLAMTATMGDLLFKLDPAKPVLSGEPDVTFTPLPSDGPSVLVVASDGLWHGLPVASQADSNAMVAAMMGTLCDGGEPPEAAAKHLARGEDRSRAGGGEVAQHYDDTSALVAYLLPQEIDHVILKQMAS
ncbi:uncharacterized protein AMSG_08504 [Thecamonas trahens ATCC 50062]|uniref:Uncharacterized protein n=1 Tax=Thecamonas trahens ATCC 50062 TaxID=461836 RepID=A0A0L0DKS0_THETB|nr:hypothetical protein AMSG_08504 [Thecamonas trahens ATCC 50062]KNC52636.1 hypothetical protein AMSG_08504 [Thecamonas trahens ATCC 50062]|eukprot:XP_013755188.1 hypothetical protein AMSG_08504 [Thecamonas trahens ATCC 50062]